MSTKRTAVTTDSDGSIHEEPDIKSLAEKSSAKKEGKRSKRLKIHHHSSQDDGNGKDCEDICSSHSKTRSKSRSKKKIKVQSSRGRNLKHVDNARFNDNTEQTKVDEENMNETERKSRIEKKDESNDQITKSVKSRERKVTKKSDDQNKKEIPEYVKVISLDRNAIKYFQKSGIQYTKSKPVVMYSRNLAADTTFHDQSRQQMLETLPKVEVIPDKYCLEVNPNDFKENSSADMSKNVCDTMNVQCSNNFKCKKKNKPEGVLRKVQEKNCTSTSNISNKFNDCVNIDKSLRLNNKTFCPLNIEENKSGVQKLPNMSVEKHVRQNEKTEQLETAVKIIRNIDEFMANKFTDKKLGRLVKTGMDQNQDYINDFRQLKSIQDKKERQHFYVNHCLTANRYRNILETNSNTFQCCTQLPPKYELVPPTSTDSIAITPTDEKKKKDESALSTVASNTESDCEIVEEIAVLSDSERHSDLGTVMLRRDNSYVEIASPDREDDTELSLFSSISSFDFRNIELDLDNQSITSDLSEPWVEENNHSAQLVLQDPIVGLLYNVHNNSNAVLDIEIQNQPNGTPMNHVNDYTEYYYLENQSDGNSDYYYYQSYEPDNYSYYYAANPSDEYSNNYYQSENYYNYVRGSSYAYDHNYYYYHQPSAPQNHYNHYYADNLSNEYGNYYYQPSASQNHYDHYYADNLSNEYGNYYYQPSAPQNHYDHYYADNSPNDYNNNYYQSGSQSHYNHYYAGNSSNEYNNYYYQSPDSQSHYDHYLGDLSDRQYNNSYFESFELVDNHVQENVLDYNVLHSVNTIPVLELSEIPSVAVTQVEDEFRVYPPLHIAVQNDHVEFSNENSTSVNQSARMVESQISNRHEQHNENLRLSFNINIVTESNSSGYRSSSRSSYSNRSSIISNDINSSSDSSTVSSESESLSPPVMIVHHSSCCGLEVPSNDESTVYISCPCVNRTWTNKPHAVVRPFQIDSELIDSDESSQS